MGADAYRYWHHRGPDEGSKQVIGTIIDLILGPIGAILGAIVAAGAVYFGGRSAGASKEKRKAVEKELKAHDRITDADVGIGASDGERAKRLREMADRWK